VGYKVYKRLLVLYQPICDIFDSITASDVIVEGITLSTAVETWPTIDADEVLLAVSRIPVEAVIIAKHTRSLRAFETEECYKH
jgi:hypothetical protein